MTSTCRKSDRAAAKRASMPSSSRPGHEHAAVHADRSRRKARGDADQRGKEDRRASDRSGATADRCHDHDERQERQQDARRQRRLATCRSERRADRGSHPAALGRATPSVGAACGREVISITVDAAAASNVEDSEEQPFNLGSAFCYSKSLPTNSTIPIILVGLAGHESAAGCAAQETDDPSRRHQPSALPTAD